MKFHKQIGTVLYKYKYNIVPTYINIHELTHSKAD